VSLIAADPGMADVLVAVPDETAVPLKEIGHATNVDAKTPPTPQIGSADTSA
jgi:hypothetical protein